MIPPDTLSSEDAPKLVDYSPSSTMEHSVASDLSCRLYQKLDTQIWYFRPGCRFFTTTTVFVWASISPSNPETWNAVTPASGGYLQDTWRLLSWFKGQQRTLPTCAGSRQTEAKVTMTVSFHCYAIYITQPVSKGVPSREASRRPAPVPSSDSTTLRH